MKKRVRAWLEERDLESIADLAVERHRVMGILIALTYDREPSIGWRAVEAMGAAADRVAEDAPDYVRDQLRKLYWLVLEESGGICWHSPAAMAEIVRRRPQLYGDYIPIVVALLEEMAEEDLGHFRVDILWAIGRLGPLAKEEMAGVLERIEACLDHEDAQVRGVAVWCLGETGHGDRLASRTDLSADEGAVLLYREGSLTSTTVSALAKAIAT